MGESNERKNMKKIVGKENIPQIIIHNDLYPNEMIPII